MSGSFAKCSMYANIDQPSIGLRKEKLKFPIDLEFLLIFCFFRGQIEKVVWRRKRNWNALFCV